MRVETPQPLRVALLKEAYAHFLVDAKALEGRLARLAPLLGKQTLARWSEAAARGDHDTLIAELLAYHYDPMYARSIAQNFPRYRDAIGAEVRDVAPAAWHALARHVIDRVAAPETVGV